MIGKGFTIIRRKLYFSAVKSYYVIQSNTYHLLEQDTGNMINSAINVKSE